MNPNTLVTALYPPHRRASGDRCPGCPDPVRLLVCLPPGPYRQPCVVLDELRNRLRPHAADTDIRLVSGHFPLRRRPDPVDAAHPLAAVCDPDLPYGASASCAGGPVGLLDLAAANAWYHARAVRQARNWTAVLAGTPPAQPWSHFLDTHNIDPDHYPVGRAVAEFQRQPRIAVLAATIGGRFGPDMYGPGLEALQAGTDCFAAYRAGVAVFADGLLTLDGRLLVASFSPLLLEQSLDERRAFHDSARGCLAAVHPATVLVAARCLRYPTTAAA